MKLGVVGLPNVGKSTLFNAITKQSAECANYPFCTIEPNVGVVNVPDERIIELATLYNSKKITPAILEFVDIAGLVKDAHKGEGLGNKFLSHIREVDAIVHVVRCFSDNNIVHVNAVIAPNEDIATIDLELIFADIESVNKKLLRIKNQAKSGDKKLLEEVAFLETLLSNLQNELAVRSQNLTAEQKEYIKDMFLLTAKPVIYVANISEADLNNPFNEHVKTVKDIASLQRAQVIVLCAKVEEELTTLDEENRQLFAKEYGISESGLNRLITAGYNVLGLISYLTAGEKETRAWTIEKGTKAPQAAGKIHTDFEKGFIRAEVVRYEDLIEYRSIAAVKEHGLWHSEGKEYVVKDGDVILFRFNV